MKQKVVKRGLELIIILAKINLLVIQLRQEKKVLLLSGML